MPNAGYFGRLINSGNNKHILKFAGGTEGAWAEWEFFSSRDATVVTDDFLGAALHPAYWATAAGAGGTAFTTTSGKIAGVASGATGTTANTVVSLSGGANFSGAKNAGMRIYVSIDTVTSYHMEVGFADVVTSKTALSVTGIDTPTIANGAGDAAFVAIDTGNTLNTLALLVKGSQAGGATSKTALGTLAPAAATQMVITLQLLGVDATHASTFVCINDNVNQQYGNGATSATELNAGTLLLPYFAFSTLNTTTKNISIDRIDLWGDR